MYLYILFLYIDIYKGTYIHTYLYRQIYINLYIFILYTCIQIYIGVYRFTLYKCTYKVAIYVDINIYIYIVYAVRRRESLSTPGFVWGTPARARQSRVSLFGVLVEHVFAEEGVLSVRRRERRSTPQPMFASVCTFALICGICSTIEGVLSWFICVFAVRWCPLGFIWVPHRVRVNRGCPCLGSRGACVR
jgi:hypothetical protein